MNQELICPQCKQSFPDEEFCPHHFVRLEPPDAPKPAKTPADAVTENTAEAPAEAAIENAAETGAAQEPESKLAQFMSRLGLRRVTDKATIPDDTLQR